MICEGGGFLGVCLPRAPSWRNYVVYCAIQSGDELKMSDVKNAEDMEEQLY